METGAAHVHTALKLIFLGSGEIAIPSLLALSRAPGIELACVVTQPDKPAGRHLHAAPPPVKKALEGSGIPVLQPEKINRPESLEKLCAFAPDVIIVCAYGQILKKPLLDLPRFGCLNIHASLLPRHRGAACIQAAIREGDRESGITIMWVDEGLDTGDILLQKAIPIEPDDTAGTLHDKLAVLAPEAILEALKLLQAGSAPRISQDLRSATYAPRLRKEDGKIDWNWPAEKIERLVRAMNPWPVAYCVVEHGGPRMLKIFKCRVVIEQCATTAAGPFIKPCNDRFRVACGKDAIQIEELQLEGGKRMETSAFLRGHPEPRLL